MELLGLKDQNSQRWVSKGQVVTDLPQSKDIAGAQQHLSKGAFRELHWHKVVSLDF